MVRSADGSAVKGVEVDGAVLEADAIVIAMGPWSLMARVGDLPAVFGKRSPSLFTHRHRCPGGCPLPRISEREHCGRNGRSLPRADGEHTPTAFSVKHRCHSTPRSLRRTKRG